MGFMRGAIHTVLPVLCSSSPWPQSQLGICDSSPEAVLYCVHAALSDEPSAVPILLQRSA